MSAAELSMAIQVPTFERVELQSPPLQLVVCQVRFPPILKLAAGQPPDEFQAGLKELYPVSSRDETIEITGGPGQPPRLFRHWKFEDKDSNWTVTLGDTFVSLETARYSRFRDFLDRFEQMLDLARRLYPIELRERLGLRYIDRISKEVNPALPDDWLQKVQSDLLPLRALKGDGQAQKGQFESRFADGSCIVTIRSSFVEAGFAGADCDAFVLDTDCYSPQRADVSGIRECLERFKVTAYNIFRWAIGDLHDCFALREESAASGSDT